MVDRVIKLTGSSNHNNCAKADSNDPKAWCYTVDSNKRWEHCSSFCENGSASSKPTPQPDTDQTATGTRVQDIPENVPTIDPRSKYDLTGNCLGKCKRRGLLGRLGELSQCETDIKCSTPLPHRPAIHSWPVPEPSECDLSPFCIDDSGEKFSLLKYFSYLS